MQTSDKQSTAQYSHDRLGKMMAWENGELGDDDTIALFQTLVDTGLAWTLQGGYGRQAKALIDAGLITYYDGTEGQN